MAGLRELLTCAECSKQKREIKKYPRKEIINFNGRNLCPNCYKPAKENEEFKIFICPLFCCPSAIIVKTEQMFLINCILCVMIKQTNVRVA